MQEQLEEKEQHQQHQNVFIAQQVALQRGAGSSGNGSTAVPSTVPSLMQQT